MIIGRLGKDPEIKYTPSGQAVCNLTVATNESWNDKTTGQKQERTEWHRVVVWGKLAELCNQYLSKGRQVYAEGKLETRSWEQDGVKRYATEIRANTVQFLEGGQPKTSNSENFRNEKQGEMTTEDLVAQMGGTATITAEDIPF